MPLQYQRLDFATFETRLLNIHPLGHPSRTESATIHGHLEHISLIDQTRYYALSYCWGDPLVTASVVIDHQTVQVTVNLDAALRELRRRGILKVWVDALCINQDDNFERGNQVQRMGEVYAGAERVFAWLGTSSSDSGAAFNALREALNRKSATQKDAAAIQFLFQRPFWRRVWIIQEIAKAKDVTLLCGGESFKWSELESATKTSSIQQLLSATQYLTFDALQEFRAREHGMRPMSLATALLNSRKSLASDPRDKIYALLGLASDGFNVVPLPNYSYSASVIAMQAARRMITGQRRISTLLLARRLTRGGAEHLPSWVPNLLDLQDQYAPWIAERIDDPHWMNEVDIRMTDTLLQLPCSFVTSVFSVSKSVASERRLRGLFQGADEGKQFSWDDINFLDDLHRCLTLGYGLYGLPVETSYAHLFRFCARSLFHFVSQCLGKSSRDVPKGLRGWIEANADLETGNGTLNQTLKRVYRWSIITTCLSRVPSWHRKKNCRRLETGLRWLDRFHMRIAVLGQETDNRHDRKSTAIRVRVVFAGASVGDKICYLPNCKLPVVLRQESDSYRYIGEVYLPAYEVKRHRAYERILVDWFPDGSTPNYVPQKFRQRVSLC